MNSAEQSPAELRLRRAWEAGLGISFGPTRALYDLDVRAMRHGRGASLFTRTCAVLACGVLAELVFADGERGVSKNADKIARMLLYLREAASLLGMYAGHEQRISRAFQALWQLVINVKDLGLETALLALEVLYRVVCSAPRTIRQIRHAVERLPGPDSVERLMAAALFLVEQKCSISSLYWMTYLLTRVSDSLVCPHVEQKHVARLQRSLVDNGFGRFEVGAVKLMQTELGN